MLLTESLDEIRDSSKEKKKEHQFGSFRWLLSR